MSNEIVRFNDTGLLLDLFLEGSTRIRLDLQVQGVGITPSLSKCTENREVEGERS